MPAFIVQGQTTNQQNNNSEEISAGIFAFSGDVTVNREGNTDADGFGINALSGAGGTATVDSDVSQSNDNSATATTGGNGAVVATGPVQYYWLTQRKRRPVGHPGKQQRTIARGIALTGSGDVYVTTTGNSTSGAEGINAVSQANAKADVSGTSVTQNNVNRLTGTTGATASTAPVLQSQSASQTNGNEQEVFSIAATFAGDVTVNSYGELDAGGTGVNAVSTTSAVALRSGTVTQTNDNGVAGTVSTVPANLGLVRQSQDISQTNDSEQFALVGAIASSGDISVTRTGKTKSDANGINAVSNAAADAESASTVTQTNKNVATATGVIVDQTQFLDQQNDNEDFLIVGSLAHSGDVSVTSSGKTEAELNGINAKSLTLAESSGKQTATQTNDNGPAQDAPAAPTGAIATGALVTQGQDVSQENNNLQLGAAISIALSGSTTVTQEDTTKAKGDGIVAESRANSIAALDQSATQTNTNGAAANLNTANITISRCEPRRLSR